MIAMSYRQLLNNELQGINVISWFVKWLLILWQVVKQ